MSFAKLEATVLYHRKFQGLDPAAVGLWAMGLIYCQDQLTDGHIPGPVLPRLVFASPPRCAQLAGMLVTRQLWEICDGGYRVHDYLDWNPSRTQVLTSRETNRQRMRALRAGAREPARAQNVRVHDRSTFAERALNVRDQTQTQTQIQARAPARATAQEEPAGPRDYPPDLFRRDCPDRRWHGRCVDAAWVARHPDQPYPAMDAQGTPKCCPEHRR